MKTTMLCHGPTMTDIDRYQLAIILAGLRLLQQFPALPIEVEEIATDCNESMSFDPAQIEDLYERSNVTSEYSRRDGTVGRDDELLAIGGLGLVWHALQTEIVRQHAYDILRTMLAVDPNVLGGVAGIIMERCVQLWPRIAGEDAPNLAEIDVVADGLSDGGANAVDRIRIMSDVVLLALEEELNCRPRNRRRAADGAERPALLLDVGFCSRFDSR